MTPIRTAITVLAFASVPTAFAQVYKCTDAGGKTVYSQTACTSSGDQPKQMKIAAAPAAAPAAVATPSGQAVAPLPGSAVSPKLSVGAAPPKPLSIPQQSQASKEKEAMQNKAAVEKAERAAEFKERTNALERQQRDLGLPHPQRKGRFEDR